MPAGYISNSAAVTAIGTSAALAKLIELNYTTAGTRALPEVAMLEALRVDAVVASGAPTTITPKLYWDAAGDVSASGASAVPVQAGLTTTTLRGFVIALGPVIPRPRNVGTEGKMYLALYVDAGTIDVSAGSAQLSFSDVRP